MDNLAWLKFRKFWFPVILYSGIIFCASSIPSVTTPLPEIRFDVVLHILLYIPFGFLTARAVDSIKISVSEGVLIGIVLLISLLYGSSDEIHQSFVPGRNTEIFDLIGDTIGGAVGGYAYLLFLRRRKNK